MASSGDESDNSVEETVVAPTRRTRSGRAVTTKASPPARRGRGRGRGARSTRNTRKKVQEEEEIDEQEAVQEETHSEHEEEVKNNIDSHPVESSSPVEDDPPQVTSTETDDKASEDVEMTEIECQKQESNDEEEKPESTVDIPESTVTEPEEEEKMEVNNIESETEKEKEVESNNIESIPIEDTIKQEDNSEDSENKSEPESDKKRKRRGFTDAPTDDSIPAKKQPKSEATVNGEEKRRKKLPELDKYWKAVKEDAQDFTGWTYLLQYVDQETDVQAAREVYDAFLKLYPYCYGYWRKYADYEKKKGDPAMCDEVFERGLRAIPLSVDLWIHFLNHCKASHPDDEDIVRQQFERALKACGIEFRSDRLWESYLKWETENNRFKKAVAIYDRLLATPTQGHAGHFDSFEALVAAHVPQELIPVEEYKQYKDEYEASKTEENSTDPETAITDELNAIREKLIDVRREIHKKTVAAVGDRWGFEEVIKRPYFHVKPLEKGQLRNWREYLEFEIEKGDQERVIVLFERCLIACALYEEFWIRFLQYLQSRDDPSVIPKIRDVYERACLVHQAKKSNLHLHWAAFEEKQRNWDKAKEILETLEKQMPSFLQLAYRRINLARRCGDLEKTSALYEEYVTSFKNQTISTNLAIKHARFCNKVKGDFEGAVSVLNRALEKDKVNSRLYLQLVDLYISRDPIDIPGAIAVFDRFLASEASIQSKATFAQRKLEFLEDFGNDIDEVMKAQEEQQNFLRQAREMKKDAPENKSIEGEKSGKKHKHHQNDWQPPMPSQPPPHSSGQYSGQYGQYPPYNQQQGYSQQGYNQTQPQQQQQYQSGSDYYSNWSGYGGYNQSWGNYNYY